MVSGSTDEGLAKRSGFLPEESFQSWSNYAKAWKEVGPRLKDRVLARSLDTTEINEIKGRSGNEMKKSLNWWDLIWFGIGSVIGAGIFVLTGLEAKTDAGPAVILSYVVSGLSALLSVLCYAEFAVEIPVAGGSFAYLRVELGDFVAFIAAGNIILEYIIGGAAVSRSWTSYLATLFGLRSDYFLIHVNAFAVGYDKLDFFAVAVIAITYYLALRSIKGSSWLNSLASIFHMVIIFFIIIAGLMHANTDNYTPFMPFGARGVFKASAVLFFAYVGFDALCTMAEETKNPARDIPIGLVGSMTITIITYCLMAVTLCLMQSYTAVDVNAPFSVAFERVGMKWANYIVAAGALIGMTTVLLSGAIGQARYVTHIARTHMVTPWLAEVNDKTNTPQRATIVMGIATAAIALFTKLDILANLLSISTLFIFMLVAVALLVRRYYATGVTTPADRNKFIVCLMVILGSSVAMALCWAMNVGGWIGYVIAATVWVVGTLALWAAVPQAKAPTKWGAPLVPLLPSLSIAMNIFLLGSIDYKSFIRFGIWTAAILVYYFLFGLHASYDTAKEFKENNEKLERAEEGGIQATV